MHYKHFGVACRSWERGGEGQICDQGSGGEGGGLICVLMAHGTLGRSGGMLPQKIACCDVHCMKPYKIKDFCSAINSILPTAVQYFPVANAKLLC